MKKQNDELLLVTNQTLANTLGLSGEWVRQLAASGVLVKHARGKFDLLASIKGYLAYRDEKDITDESDTRWRKFRADLYEQRVRAVRVESDLRVGKAFDADAITYVMGAMLHASRARLLAIPSATAATVADLGTAEECRQVLDEACRGAAEEISSFNPESVISRYRETSKQEAPVTISDL